MKNINLIIEFLLATILIIGFVCPVYSLPTTPTGSGVSVKTGMIFQTMTSTYTAIMDFDCNNITVANSYIMFYFNNGFWSADSLVSLGYLVLGYPITVYNGAIFETPLTKYTAIKDFNCGQIMYSNLNFSTGIFSSGSITVSTSNITFYMNNGVKSIYSMVYYGYFVSEPLPIYSILKPVELILDPLFYNTGYLQLNGTNYQVVQSSPTANIAYDSNQMNHVMGGVSGFGLFFGQLRNSSGLYTVDRTFLTFDTSSIVKGLSILNVTLRLGVYYAYSADSQDSLVVCNSSLAHTPIDFSDYDKTLYSIRSNDFFGFAKKSSLHPSLPSLSYKYSNISLTNSSVTEEGLTKFCLRTSREISGLAPNGDEEINIQGAGYFYGPELVIWYKGASEIDVGTSGYELATANRPSVFIDNNFAGFGSANIQIPIGYHTISFENYFNYITPSPVTVNSIQNQIVSVMGVYHTPPVGPPPSEPISFFGILLTSIISSSAIIVLLGFIIGALGSALNHGGWGFLSGMEIGLFVCAGCGGIINTLLPPWIFYIVTILIFIGVYFSHNSGGA